MTHATTTPAAQRQLRYVAPLMLLACAVVLVAVLLPPLRHPLRVARLLAAPAPDSLPVPVPGVRATGLANTWGAARSGGRSHEGIDIFARRNTPVRSTTEGVVVSTEPNNLGGECIVVLGPGGHRHYYAHLHRHGQFGEGDWVRVGDTIGYVGNTGNARTTPPHLHYGIYTTSGAINPYPLLTRGRKAVAAKPHRKKSRRSSARNNPVRSATRKRPAPRAAPATR